mmetsp:Transcript_44137/g.116791  ORF Transcript_44137/g.116791 Transcript_44137/m.116791 type:complete len:220 (-) Transcript_44137:2103-2762(-)
MATQSVRFAWKGRLTSSQLVDTSSIGVAWHYRFKRVASVRCVGKCLNSQAVGFGWFGYMGLIQRNRTFLCLAAWSIEESRRSKCRPCLTTCAALACIGVVTPWCQKRRPATRPLLHGLHMSSYGQQTFGAPALMSDGPSTKSPWQRPALLRSDRQTSSSPHASHHGGQRSSRHSVRRAHPRFVRWSWTRLVNLQSLRPYALWRLPRAPDILSCLVITGN